MKINKTEIKVLVFFLMVFMTMAILFSWEIVGLNQKLEIVQNELIVTQDELTTTKENYQIEIEKTVGLSASLGNACKELEEANTIIADLKSDEYKLVYMGGFKITYYCDERRDHICGGNGVTASGKPTEVGVTAAADWSVLPRGSMVYIEGVGFREVQDVGGGVNGGHIDVLVQTHQEALSLGTDHEGVWLLIKKTS